MAMEESAATLCAKRYSFVEIGQNTLSMGPIG